MKPIEEQINQKKPFVTVEEEVYVNLQHTAEVLEDFVAEKIKITALTPRQYNVLRILRGAGSDGLDSEQVVARMYRKESDMPTLFSILESRGLIEMQLADNRKIVRIKQRALDLLQMIEESLRQSIVAQMDIIGEDMLQQLNTLLILLRHGLSER